jgi:RHS repeat-associated protein
MTGGVYPVTAYDSGTVNVTVGSYTASVSYGQTSTSASVASALAANFNAAGGSPVNATANSNTIAFSDRATGSNAYAYSSSTTHSSTFASASFSVTPASGTLNSTDHETAPSLATPWTTTYAYDALDRLRTVNQGVQTRTYVYDDAGRLTSVTTPESGKTDYTYYAHGGVYQRTDARGIVTTYSYDALNRPTTTTYNDNGTPSVTLAYDAGGAAAHALGQLTSMIDGSGSETLTYDNLGRLFSRVKVISGNSYTVGYGYDDMGDLTSLTYPSGRVVTQSYDRIGRMTTIASAGTNYLSGATYNAAGKTLGFTYGNGITAAFTYNDHQQLETLKYSNALTDIFKLTYGYGANNNSQIASITDNVNGNVRSMAYTYDQVGRLKSAQTVDLTSANTWKLEWTYDRYGNRLTQTQTGGTASTPQPQVTVNPANNHIFFNPPPAPEPYDAAGNMTSDGIHTYTYDAENRIKSLDGGGTYAYDGNNIRVQYGNTMYVFSGSKVIAEYTSSGLQKEYVYAGGQLLLSLDVSGTLVYAHMDHLSTRVELDGSQSTVRSFGHFPFGEVWYETGTVNKSKFTTYERDVEVDYAMMRYYHPRLGRFMTSDPISGSTADPQSLNSFSYVMGDPIKLTDALGLCPKPSIPGHCSGIMYPTTWNPNADRKDPSCGINIFCIGGPFHGNPNCVGAECVRTGMAQVSGSSAYADNVGIGGWGYVNGWVCVTTHDSATNTSGGGCTWERIPTPTQGAYNLYSYEARAAGETPLDRLGWLTFQGSRKAWNTAAHGLPAVCGPFGGFFYFHVYGPVNGIVEWDSQDGWSAGGLGEIGPFGGTATAAKNGIHKEGLIFAGPEEGLGAFSTISRTPQVGPYYGFKIPKTNIAAGVGAYVTVKSVADCN